MSVDTEVIMMDENESTEFDEKEHFEVRVFHVRKIKKIQKKENLRLNQDCEADGVNDDEEWDEVC